MARIRGRLADAERHTRLAIEVNEQRGLPGVVLADAADLARDAVVFRADSAGALRILETALAEHPLHSMPSLDRPGRTCRAGLRPRGAPRAGPTSAFGLRGRGARRSPSRSVGVVPRTRLARPRGRPPAGRHLRLRAGSSRLHLRALRLMGRRRRLRTSRPGGLGARRVPTRRRPGRALEKPGRPVGARRPASSVSASSTRPGATAPRALEYYGRFVELWKEADPVLQPAVREVRGRMAALAGEGK